jgi:ABC-2 type transport system permease protein
MKYLHLTAISLKTALAYRTQFFTSLLSSIIWLAVMWFVWTAVFSSSATDTIRGLTLPAMITYMTISIAIKGLFESDNEARIESLVKTGAIVTTLIRPIYYPFSVLFQELGPTILALIVRSIPIVLIAVFAFGIAPPASPLAFLLSVTMAWLISWSLVYLTGLWAFWTTGSIWGIRRVRRMVEELFSGATIPLYLFPGWLAGVAYLLPFQAMFNIPISIYTGLISGPAVLSALSLQLGWVLALGLACWAVWRRAERKMVIQGG